MIRIVLVIPVKKNFWGGDWGVFSIIGSCMRYRLYLLQLERGFYNPLYVEYAAHCTPYLCARQTIVLEASSQILVHTAHCCVLRVGRGVNSPIQRGRPEQPQMWQYWAFQINAPTSAVQWATTQRATSLHVLFYTALFTHCVHSITDLAQSLTDFNLFTIENATCAIFQCVQFWVVSTWCFFVQFQL